MRQIEETVSVAKSTIIFKTTDEWFKTLVSGVVETFFSDKELTFSIEMKPLKTLYGYCSFKKPCHIVINSRYKNDGVDFAGTIAHEIIHTFVDKDVHGKEFRKEAKQAELILTYWTGYTEPTQKFAEKIVPTLEKCGYTAVREKDAFRSEMMNVSDDFEPFVRFIKENPLLKRKNLIGFEKKKNGKWVGYPYYDETYFAVNRRAVDTICQQLEFLDKTVFAGQQLVKKQSYRFIYPDASLSDNVEYIASIKKRNGLSDLFYKLNRVYFRKNSKKYKASFQIFNQLMNDKKAEAFDVKPDLFMLLGTCHEEVLTLSKPKDDFYFSLSAQQNTPISENQIIQIRNLCQFLYKCLFWMKQTVKRSVLIRANQPKENVEEYCSYLSRKLAELFGADPVGIRENEYLPFLEGFGNLICENEAMLWRTVYKRDKF